MAKECYVNSKKVGSIHFGVGKSNCLTYIPEDIKLDLTDGTLTLLAGSKVYIPNGVGVFDEVIINNDTSRAITPSSSYTGVIFYNYTQNRIGYDRISVCTSGTTAPTESGFFYNTNDNTIKYYSSGTAGSDLCSLPIAIVSVEKSVGFVSIDQIFNGFGYIGSNYFILPKVKALLPNELNENKTYKSIEFEVSRVLTQSLSGSFTRVLFLTNQNNGAGGSGGGVYYYEQPSAPNIDQKNYERWYDTNDNKMYYHENNATSWSEVDFQIASVGTVVTTNGKITSLTPKSIQTQNMTIEVKRIYKGSTLIWGYDPSEVIFQSSAAGTYTVNIATSGYYNVTVVGGGSGGAYVYSSKFSDGRASGGSGAGFKGVVYLSAGNHTVKVGAGGVGQAYESNGQSSATSTAGGQSSIDSIIVAGGAGSAKAGIHGATQTAGSGGTLSYDSSKVKSYTLATNGNTGTTVYNSNITGATSVLSGTTHGAGGNAGNSYTTSGKNGYVLISAV